jgi:regulation of enolase protein 1 (concanavalin A-like superfamily)
MNLLQDVSKGWGALLWKDAPEQWEVLPGGGLRVYAPARSDYFQNPSGDTPRDFGPYLWLPVEGDFVAQAHVRPTFAATYDSGVLMVRHDEKLWAKLCFEATDFGTHAAVSVVTNGVSDDANGVDLTTPDLWLQIVRAGDLFAMHYATDGIGWRMVRYFRLPVPPGVQVGWWPSRRWGRGQR